MDFQLCYGLGWCLPCPCSLQVSGLERVTCTLWEMLERLPGASRDHSPAWNVWSWHGVHWWGALVSHLPPSFPGLKTGGGSSGGSGNTFHYTFHGDPHATFASFFGGSNPFDIFFASSRSRMFNGFDQEDMDIDDDDDPFSAFGRFGFNGINGVHRRHQESLHTRRKVQDPPVIHELKVSLEEIYHGSTKRMKITRRRLNADGRTMRTEDKILNIVIKRGWKEGTKITFPKEGDATPDNIPADIVFILKDKPHSHFKRDGTNVVYTANISLKEVGMGGKSHRLRGGAGWWHVGPSRESVLVLHR